MKEAGCYKPVYADVVQCFLCPHHCRISSSEAGKCRVRVNEAGKLIAKSYGLVSALHSDPVEKKPLYHFYPGKRILSIGSYGCNLQCIFCQNWEISQSFPEYPDAFRLMDTDQIIARAAGEAENIGIAFTYNEPIVNYEFVYELAAKAKLSGMKTAMITNGYIAEQPLRELISSMDAFNVDLKVFSSSLYKSFAGGSLNPVLRTLKMIRNSGKHLEITHLVVTGMNDKTTFFDPMIEWIARELGEYTVLHISRYFPNYQMSHAPTSPSILSYMFDKARSKLPYTYLGNIILPGTSDTFCHNCRTKVIERQAYCTKILGLNQNGNCRECGQAIIKEI
ncbi:MAG TPA: AmmeMemoRadiSam system radical SAM enzyme [Bacteroidales bacterium]|nr:AmmeMemoRadiSam system radical SAM enzyme [Bacteroidales bacterium]